MIKKYFWVYLERAHPAFLTTLVVLVILKNSIAFVSLCFAISSGNILRKYFSLMSNNKILQTFFNHLFVIQFIFLTRFKILSVLTNNMKIFNYMFEEFTFCGVFVTGEICFVISVFSTFCWTLNRGTGHFQKVCFRY